MVEITLEDCPLHDDHTRETGSEDNTSTEVVELRWRTDEIRSQM